MGLWVWLCGCGAVGRGAVRLWGWGCGSGAVGLWGCEAGAVGRRVWILGAEVSQQPSHPEFGCVAACRHSSNARKRGAGAARDAEGL